MHGVRVERGIVFAILLAGLLVVPALSGPVSASDVPVTLIAKNVAWHVGNESAPPKPTITVTGGDVLRLTIENHDTINHTFTIPHFGIDTGLLAGATIFVNITTANADNGTWQFYCAVPGHTVWSYPNLDGMVGWVHVTAAPATPATPGLDTVIVVLAFVGVAAVARVAVRRKEA